MSDFVDAYIEAKRVLDAEPPCTYDDGRCERHPGHRWSEDGYCDAVDYTTRRALNALRKLAGCVKLEASLR